MKKFTLLTCLFISFNLFAQPFSMVKEINTTATAASGTFPNLARIGNLVFYTATDAATGTELWKSDGTDAGTVLVKDINPGTASSINYQASSNSTNIFMAYNGLLFFPANDGVNGNEPWCSDGTAAGTFLLKDISPGTASSTVTRFFFHNNIVFFIASNSASGAELWKTDGTTTGTVMVKDINPGSASSLSTINNPYFFTTMGADVYFPATNGINGNELWKTDGTDAGTVMVKDIIIGGTASLALSAHKAAAFNGRLYFSANSGAAVTGTELWSTDGTDAGTSQVKDIVPGTGSSLPNNLIVFNGALYFTASSTNGANPDLWKTDGTDAGTVLVRSMSADGVILNTGNAIGNEFTVVGNKLIFRAVSLTYGSELFGSDGTTAGTGLIKDIIEGSNGSVPSGLFVFAGNAYFISIDPILPSRGGVLYKTDGTTAGTIPLPEGELRSILGTSSAALAATETKLFFLGNTTDIGAELWSTDGSSAGTSLVKDINSTKNGTPNSGWSLFGSTVFNSNYYYVAADNDNGYELWKSNGTTAGTVMVKDIWPGKGSSNPANFFAQGGFLYFSASDGVNGAELWKTDGTEAGTVMVANIATGNESSVPLGFTTSNGFVYFQAYHPSYGNELWRSDGTAAGTTMVLDLMPGTASGFNNRQDVATIGNYAYYIINIPAGNTLGIAAGNKLIKVDGATNTISDFLPTLLSGTDLCTIGSTLYISGRSTTNQSVLWKSENGGAPVQVKLINTTATNVYQLTNINGKLYFTAGTTASGVEPWTSDGTDVGTFMLKDINPGSGGSNPYQFVASGGKVYFSASIGTNTADVELWETDGTTAGTLLVKDILPGTTGSRPNNTIAAPGNKIFFTATDGISGIELWQSNGTAAGTSLLKDFNTNGDGFPLSGTSLAFPADFILSKLDDKIIFFARSADKGLQLYSGNIAGRYKYVNDNANTNDIFTTDVGNNANNGSQSAPYATLNYAISQASEGDTIYVDAGVYFEQVTIDKGITLIGAGSGVTIVWKPAVINPPPGPFTEPGTIQTAQNIGDVHIRDMSVTGDNNGVTPIILQTGGSVKNCRLIGGNQGIFFRVNPAIKTALIENNYINVAYIGINCQGSGLSASLINNTIELNNPFFAAGVFAGLDFGPLVRFTAFGNIIRNYNAQGMLANSFNTNITQNSFTGTGAHAIEQGINSLGFATCNWYGTTNAATVASKVSGFFSYTPYLTDGTNTITTYGNYGFLPVAGTCAEGVSNFYVNDNSRTNDVFTTAVGSNSNPGTRSAPFATLSYAISVAPVNSVIHVDAGTYAEQVIIDRGIVINGAGKELTNFVKPVAALVPAPGPFTEIGLIATTQGIGDVHIRNISVNSIDGTSQNIIIQSGGSVKNCKLLNGGQGVFFRYASGSRNAEVSFNTIQPTGIGINCQGAGLTANIVNNTISNPAGYYSGIFAGLDFGPLPQLTITNNKISDYFSLGILSNANSSNVTNNSIVGTSQSIAIQGNALNATCNWYGSNTPAISGPVIYSPFLTDGTDNDIYNLGFQPVPGSCNGVQHKFYVNDNSNIGNVFTTAVGDDNNSGAPSTPLLTFNAAYTKAQAGDTIYVDAGTYITPNIAINKAVTILGTNYLINPNDETNPLLPNAARNSEAIISGSTLTIGANNISIEGLTLDPGNKSQVVLSSASFSNFNFKKNKLIIGTGTLISLVGPSTTDAELLTASDYLFADNRFEKLAVGNGITLSLAYIKNFSIHNNAFVITGPASRNQIPIIVGNGFASVVDNLSVTNNVIDRHNYNLFSYSIVRMTITGNKFYNARSGLFIQANYPGSTDIRIEDNLIEHNLPGVPVLDIMPCRIFGSTSGNGNISIRNNTINIDGTGLTSLPPAISPLFAATVANPSLVVSGNRISHTGSYNLFPQGVTGIGLVGKNFNSTVENNEVVFNGQNIIASFVHSGISTGTDGVNGMPASSVLNYRNNKVSGYKQSITFYDGTASAADPYVGYGNLPIGATVNINNNSFTGDSISINNGSVGQPVLATCNWYGSADAAVVVPKISANVNYSPWLTNSTDNDVATGFQPLPNVCNGRQNKFYVNDVDITGDVFTIGVGNDANSGIPSAPLATLQEAINRAQNSDEIYMDAGTYSNIGTTIGKSLIIRGTNYLISPNDASVPLTANAGRNAETIINTSTFTIGASDITFSGFMFSPQSASQFVQTNSGLDFGNLTLSNNIFRMNNNIGNNQINLTGKLVSPLVTSNYIISNNRFVKESGTSGGSISINAVENTQIQHNVFTTDGALANAFNVQNGIIIGSANGSTSIMNNTAYRFNVFTNGIASTTTLINNNKTLQCFRFAFTSSGNPNPNQIEITDNIITNPTSNGGPVISYARSNGVNLSSPNIARIERNIITLDGTGLTAVAQSLIAPTLDAASANTQVFIRNNKLTITGDFSSLSSPSAYVSAIRYLTNSRYTLVENNEMEFTATNFNGSNKFGIGILHSGLQPGTDFNFLNNKFSGFPTSVGIQGGGVFGQLPNGVSMNINNNSFIGDVMSINNGTTGQGVEASCNWYGSAAAQNIINKLTLSTVNIVPWLTNGIDNDPATGFQPVPNSCDGYPTLITLNSSTNVTCNGAANGTINITTSYGKAPFTYTWTKDGDANFVSNNEDLTGLAPGTYRLAITDGNGSNIYIIDENANGPGTLVVTITEPDVLTASATGTNNICFNGAIGSASVSPAGGTAPYTYLWSNGATTSEITNLAAGTYSVTVTDANGCTANAQYEVTQPTLLTASITNNSTACSNNAMVTAAGSTAPYTYLWSNGSASSSITGVIAGTYSVTVTDANGCTASASIILTVSGAFNPTAAATDVTCYGANNGIITVTNANGTAPFTFSINGVNFLPGSFPYSFTNLAPGTYTVAARDVNGCTGFVTRTVLQPAQLVVTLTTVQSTCFGLNTGSVSVTAAGGTGALSYSWTGVGGYTSSQKNISSLATGNYALTVTDKNGCTAILNVFVPSLTQITVNSTVNNIACKGELNGSIILNVTGGTGNFSYLWNTGATTSSISNLITGNYSVTVTDIGSGCVVTRSYSITQPASALNISTSKTNATGCATLGTITATAGTSGTAPYTYSIDGINYQTSGSFAGLYAGTYYARVKDANGCIKTSAALSITDNGSDAYESNNSKNNAKAITIGPVINARIALATDVADWFKFTTPAGTGNYIMTFTHPTPSFTFNMYPAGNNAPALVPVNPTTATTKEYVLDGNTTYFISITGGLSYTCYNLSIMPPAAPITRNNNNSIEVKPMLEANLSAQAYPNPHKGSFNIRIVSPETGTAHIELFTITGQKMGEKTVSIQKGEIKLVPFKSIHHGSLVYRIQLGKHVATGKVIGIE